MASEQQPLPIWQLSVLLTTGLHCLASNGWVSSNMQDAYIDMRVEGEQENVKSEEHKLQKVLWGSRIA